MNNLGLVPPTGECLFDNFFTYSDWSFPDCPEKRQTSNQSFPARIMLHDLQNVLEDYTAAMIWSCKCPSVALGALFINENIPAQSTISMELLSMRQYGWIQFNLLGSST
jgi:hypothetical protein